MKCPSCGSESSGRFCRGCGAALAGRSQAVVSLPWAIAGGACIGLMVLLIMVLARREPAAGGSGDQGAFAGTTAPIAPDISNMTPRERFDRLYNRVMTAAEAGDQATVTQFSPMAVMAYSQLDSIDADARFHLALLTVHTGDDSSVEALADPVLLQNPGHLFGYMIRGARARFAKDDAALKRAYADFLEHYEAEMAKERAEYGEHKRSVEDFRKAAEASRN